MSKLNGRHAIVLAILGILFMKLIRFVILLLDDLY